jgi:hypothetical protein
MSHVLTSTSESYEKFLNNIIGKENSNNFYTKKSSSEKFRSSLAARGIGGGMHMMLSSLSDHHHHRHHSSGSSEDSPASSPSPRGWSSGRRTWHRKEKKDKEREKEKDLKKTRKHSKKEGHHVEELTTTAAAAESPPSFGRRLSLKLPRSPRGSATTEHAEGTGGESPEMKHANSAPQLLPIPTPTSTPGHGPPTTASSPTPGHHSHHLVSKLFSSTRRFSSAGKKEAMAAKADKWGTGDYTTALHPGGLADAAEAERKKKEAEDLRKKEEKDREDKRQQERERERYAHACRVVCVVRVVLVVRAVYVSCVVSKTEGDVQASTRPVAMHLRTLQTPPGALQRSHPQLPRTGHVLATRTYYSPLSHHQATPGQLLLLF